MADNFIQITHHILQEMAQSNQYPTNWDKGWDGKPYTLIPGEHPVQINGTWYLSVRNTTTGKNEFYNFKTDICEPEEDVLPLMHSNRQ